MLPLLEHRFCAEIERDGAPVVTTGELQPDWGPALEWCVLQRRRAGDAAPAVPDVPDVRLCPVWDPDRGAPYVSHLIVDEPAPAAGAGILPLQYFSGAVERGVTLLVEQGLVRDGDAYRWHLCAFPAVHRHGPPPAADGFDVQAADAGPPLPLLGGLRALLARARHRGPTDDVGTDLPVLMSSRVLREAQVIARAAGTLEAGGVLVGTLARDAAGGDLVLQVTAQVPAREAVADVASLRFTAETWKAVHAALRLRGDDEVPVGWWHSHPAALWPCRHCGPERRAICPSNRAFFSPADVGFQRTAFPAAHQVALLLSFLDDPAPRFDLFGWRRGIVCARGYHLLEDRP